MSNTTNTSQGSAYIYPSSGGKPIPTSTTESNPTPTATGTGTNTSTSTAPPTTGSGTSQPTTGGNSPPPTASNPLPPMTGANPPPPTTGGNTTTPTTGENSSQDGGEGGAVVGDDGVLQPVAAVVNGAVTELNHEVEQAADTIGLGHLVSDLTDVVESTGLGHIGEDAGPNGNSNLITDVVEAPTEILAGDLDGAISDVSNDLSDVLMETFELKDDALLEGNDPVNIVPDLVQSVGGGLQTLPLVNIGGSGDLLGGTVGDLSNSSSGHLIDIGLGSTSENGLSLDLLSTSGDDGSALGIHVLDVGSNGPSLLDLHLLGGEGLLGGLGPVLGSSENGGLLGSVLPQADGEGGGLLGGLIDIPTLGGAGGDSLVGDVLGSVTQAGGGETDPLAIIPTAGIVAELVAEVTHALDQGQSQHNHGLLGIL